MNNSLWRMRAFCLFITIVLLILFATPRSMSAAQASVHSQTIPLYIDCSHIPNDPRSVAFLEQRGLCGYGSHSVVTPNTEWEGDCGLIRLESGNGIMQWKTEITSYVGPWIFINYSGSWSNWDTGRSGPVSRSYWTFRIDEIDTFPVSTGAGLVESAIPAGAAQATNFFGLICYSGGRVWDIQVIS